MMEKIILQKIHTNRNVVIYEFLTTEGLKKYFSGKAFSIEYPIDISTVPESVLAVPFVCNVLPIIWLTNSALELSELDKDFYECIPEVKKGYEAMFPESVFAGKVCPKTTIENISYGNGCALLFSGGLDATQTLISHLEEKPHLISIWGSDIRFENEDGWKAVHNGIAETAQRFGLPDIVIRSSFRDFDDEGVLHSEFTAQLKDSWWHGVKHALGLLGHVAPYAYCYGLSIVYIAASNCPADGVVRCASNPTIDNHIRYAGCQVRHDGFEYSRQDKVHNVISFAKDTGKRITLHACWQSQSGSNCCRCEKCYRTMAAILAEGADPVAFGFYEAQRTLPDMQSYIVEGKALNANLAISYWQHIQKRASQNRKILRKTENWKHIKWLASVDFWHHEKITMPLKYRMKKKLATYRFYQVLSKIKGKLK